jgi:post-segregation antitoxin (ccd killing protein)
VPPAPILSDTDPVLAQVLRLAGLSVSTAGDGTLDCGEGMTVEDAKVACYMWREEATEADAWRDRYYVRTPDDGWAMDTELRQTPEDDELVNVDEPNSQPVFGFWMLPGPPGPFPDALYVRGFNYDMYAAAASLCDMLAEKMKMQFDFNDGSGSYPRSQKYSQTKQCAADLWKRARPRSIDMQRADTVGSGWDETWREFADQS